MSQNKGKIIERLIGHLSNVIVHSILNKASPPPEIKEKYQKELANSLAEATKYRELINPKSSNLTENDAKYIKECISKRAGNELLRRISAGYRNVHLNLIDLEINNRFKELNITS